MRWPADCSARPRSRPRDRANRHAIPSKRVPSWVKLPDGTPTRLAFSRWTPNKSQRRRREEARAAGGPISWRRPARQDKQGRYHGKLVATHFAPFPFPLEVADLHPGKEAAPMHDTPYRPAVIGRTGRGDYGHGLDVAVLGHPRLRVVAVADEDPAGRAAAARRLGVENAYGDYRAMLAKERPQFVVVAPRWLDGHKDM